MSNVTSPATSIHSFDQSDEGSQSWMQWKQQLQAYVAWINSQLKKKPGARPVEDLRNDMKDGVAFIDLIEIVGGERVPGAHEVPSNYSEMLENVERVLHFMSTNRIRMHHTGAKDIVDGNLKAIMRLILALAAHFKPNSVKHSAYQHFRSPNIGANVAGIAQGAAAALADARRNASRAGHRYRRSRDAAVSERRYQGSSSDQCSDSDQSYKNPSRSRSRLLRERRELDGASNSSSPSSSLHTSPRTSLNFGAQSKDSSSQLARSKSSDYVSAKDSGAEIEDVSTVVDKTHYDELLQEYGDLADAMRATKQELMRLQDLLLSGREPDGETSSEEMFEGSTPKEKLVVLKSRLLQSSERCENLKEELSRAKNDCLQLQGIKAGLQHRLSEQDSALSQLKSDLLRRDFDKQVYEADKAGLVKQLREQEKTVADLKRDIMKRDQKIDQLQNELRNQILEKETITRTLKSQIQELHNRLRVVGETGATLSARVASQDKRMAKLEGKIFQGHSENGGSPSGQSGTDELQMVRDSLQNLRVQIPVSDPQHHTIDTLEHSIAMLLEHMYSASGTVTPVNQSQVTVESSPKRLNFDSSHDLSRTPVAGYAVNRLDSPSVNGQPCTKVLYFTDKTVTPFMCTIHKRLGEITLKDFKGLFDKPEVYRYHFKALDPEYGTVKEELALDDAVIPGWEGKIVAWIEEDQSTAC